MSHQNISIANSILDCAKKLQSEFSYGENFVFLTGVTGSGRTNMCEHVVNALESKFTTIFIPCQNQMSIEQLRQLFLQQIAPTEKWDETKPLPSFDGLLLIQLGTPASASPAAVGKYLLEFLGDPHALGNPPFFWKPLLRFGIVPLRSRSSAAKYRAMLALSHSSEMPLLTHTKAFARGVAEKIGTRMKVSFAFQYGTGPSISEALGAFAEQGLKNLCVIPLYPQRSSATGGAAAALVRDAAKNFPDISLHFVDGFARPDAWARI